MKKLIDYKAIFVVLLLVLVVNGGLTSSAWGEENKFRTSFMKKFIPKVTTDTTALMGEVKAAAGGGRPIRLAHWKNVLMKKYPNWYEHLLQLHHVAPEEIEWAITISLGGLAVRCKLYSHMETIDAYLLILKNYGNEEVVEFLRTYPERNSDDRDKFRFVLEKYIPTVSPSLLQEYHWALYSVQKYVEREGAEQEVYVASLVRILTAAKKAIRGDKEALLNNPPE
jgi:hypothetical protein